MSHANGLWEQEEEDPSQVSNTGHVAWTDDFLATGPCIFFS